MPAPNNELPKPSLVRGGADALGLAFFGFRISRRDDVLEVLDELLDDDLSGESSSLNGSVTIFAGDLLVDRDAPEPKLREGAVTLANGSTAF